jgi:serine/threonine protein kinase
MAMEKFGDLLLMERLAAGGMAEVYRGKQIGYAGFEKTVAIKRILPHFAASEEFKNMFRMEANLSAMLQHSNITQVFSNGEHQGYLYLVMEFVDGKNLRQLLARADKLKLRIPLEVACYMVSEALKGLDYAHNFIDDRTGEPLNIVHRDVSPQNIMLGYEGSVKIVDFGIAKAASKAESTRAGVLKGKFGYMSPEQARGAKLDKKSDLFSMGIILWELITQRRLFTYEDEMKTLEKVRECKVPKPSEKNPTIPYALEKIVLRALEKDPSNRYASCAEFYGDLVRYMNDRHPSFIPTDFTAFMKNVYKEDIHDEKKRREKLNLEAPAFLAKNPNTKKSSSSYSKAVEKTKTSTSESTAIKPEDKTQVSGIHEGAHLDDLRDMLNQDPTSAEDVGLFSSNLGNTANKKIQLKIADPVPDVASATQSQISMQTASHARANTAANLKIKKANVNKVRAVAVVAALALFTYGALTYLPRFLGEQVAKGIDRIDNSRNPSQDAYARDELSDQLAVPKDVDTSEEAYAQVPEQREEAREPAALSTFIWQPRSYNVYGSINLSSVPDADEIILNGKKLVDANEVPIKTPLRSFRLPPGSYKLVLKNTVFGVSKKITVTIEKDRLLREDVILNERR